MSKYDISGETFGYWTVIRKDGIQTGKRNSRWICRCICGVEKSVIRSTLVSGSSKSCGCMSHKNLKGINKTHGMSKTRLYSEWARMRERCRNPNGKFAKNYFERGIKVCHEWENSFSSFQSWALSNGYSDNLTIDRINNDLGYSPDNCRWIPFEEQSKNRTNTIFIDYGGKKECLGTICREIGFPYKLAHSRYYSSKKRGCSISAEQLFAPKYNSKKS